MPPAPASSYSASIVRLILPEDAVISLLPLETILLSALRFQAIEAAPPVFCISPPVRLIFVPDMKLTLPLKICDVLMLISPESFQLLEPPNHNVPPQLILFKRPSEKSRSVAPVTAEPIPTVTPAVRGRNTTSPPL